MKIRMDYVSNSSSSSFVLFGEKVQNGHVKRGVTKGKVKVEYWEDHVFDVTDFDSLKENEAFFIILPDRGSEGDYVFQLTPEMLNDFDLRQIDLSKFTIIKGRYCLEESSNIYDADMFNMVQDNHSVLWNNEKIDALNHTSKSIGLPIGNTSMFKYNLDYGCPKPFQHSLILDEIEEYAQHTK